MSHPNPTPSRPQRAATLLVRLACPGLLTLAAGLVYFIWGKEAGAQSLYPAIILCALAFALFGAVGVYASKCCRHASQHGEDARNTAQTLLSNLGSCILLLDRQGKILFANPAACELLHTTPEKLSIRKFQELCVSGKRPIPERYGQSTYLSRTSAPPLPVSFRNADIALPSSAAAGFGEEENTETTLLVFSDLSRPLELEQQLAQVERITAATRIAGEMAHEIRTPLTAISASVQLLKHYEEKTTAADWLPNSPRRKDRTDLFAHIMAASDRMDSTIKNFVDFADFSPNDLLSIIKLDSIDGNHGYIGRLNTIAKGFENGQDSDSGRRSDNFKFVEQNTADQGI